LQGYRDWMENGIFPKGVSRLGAKAFAIATTTAGAHVLHSDNLRSYACGAFAIATTTAGAHEPLALPEGAHPPAQLAFLRLKPFGQAAGFMLAALLFLSGSLLADSISCNPNSATRWSYLGGAGWNGAAWNYIQNAKVADNSSAYSRMTDRYGNHSELLLTADTQIRKHVWRI